MIDPTTIAMVCPKCNCRRFIGNPPLKRCGNCGAFVRSPVAEYTPASVQCPHCHGDTHKVRSVQGRKRYHTCLNPECGCKYISKEPIRRRVV